MFFFWGRSNTIAGIYTYSSGRKHTLRKTPYLPNHICYASAVYLTRKLTFTAIFSARPTDQFGAIFNPKNTSETNATNNTPSTWKTYKLSRHRWCCLASNVDDTDNHSHSGRCQPLTDCKARATQRSLRVTVYTGAALQNANTARRTFFVICSCVVKKRLGSM